MQKCNVEYQGPSGVKPIKHSKQALFKYINNKTSSRENVDLVRMQWEPLKQRLQIRQRY